MNVTDLIALLGHTSGSTAFRAFLREHGMNRLPRVDPTTRVRSSDKLVSLEFDLTESYRETHDRGPVGDGWLTFRSVDVHQGFGGVLPLGLSHAMSKDDVDALLGSSRDVDQSDPVQIYYSEPILVIVFYGDGGTTIETLRFAHPNRYDIENYGL
ncbi:hypothetical protein DEU38_11218 [Rhodococcus sp. AG1013]|uniref:hypothetical protein n=1 Tax=Rhodococcus sp. AG1013 TaxID=2183996 RepID=UPI000E0C9981|nr:hypothetical protein [Rhodococcus sp. AG1013]RDI23154.1 hypothetical protein DEU38_11218 [Rhodococcus sp. AG1013]